MSKKQNDLFTILLFSIFCLVKPVSYDEMVSRHRIYSQETELVHKKCSNLKDFVLSVPDELELLEKSNEIILPKIINADIKAIEEVKEISSNKDENFELKKKAKTNIKTRLGTDSIFVEGWSQIRTFPARPRLNYYDSVEQRIVRPRLLFQAHLTCNSEQNKLPRKITKQDKTVKFKKNFRKIFNENYEVFGYNLYLEEDLSKNASKKEVIKAKDNLWKKYKSASQEYLRENLFRNPCIIKSEKCKYLDTSDYVTIYYNQLTDLFAIVNQKSNCLLDFGIATKVKYAEIFAYKSSGSLKATDICLSPNEKLEENSDIDELLQINPSSTPSREFPKSKQPPRQGQSSDYSKYPQSKKKKLIAESGLPLDAQQKLLKNPELLELSIDPRSARSDKIDKQSFDEAESILQLQKETGLFEGVRRANTTEKIEWDIDFILSGSRYDEADIKTPTSFYDSRKGPKKPIPQDLLDYLARESGAKSIAQKIGSKRCLHVLDLKDIQPHQKEAYKANFLQGAREADPVLAEHIIVQNE